MNPNDPNAPQPIPAPEPPASTPPQPSADDVPVFRNPLAQGYEGGTSQLPPIPPTTSEITPPNPVPAPDPASLPTPLAPTPSPLVEPQSEPISPVATAQPTVSELSNSPIKPAPVRLAPVPRSDDMHAGGLQSTSQAMPFGGGTSENIAPAPATSSALPAANTAKRKPIGLIVGLAVGLVVILLAAIGGYAYITSRKDAPPTAAPSTSTGSVRDKTEKPTQPFSEKVSTDCYVAQSLTPVDTQQNKDCALSITYGEQKISSITVSPQRDFNLVADQSSGQASDGTTRFDTEKYLDALIANAISKDLIVTREKLTVGGLEATKVVGKQQASSASIVAYVFIVLPEGDRKFNEKTFVAFIITGAYNDDYSRKGFDQALSTWSWK